MDIGNTIGEKIKNVRISRHMTQKELATLIGVTDATVNRYEKNVREPNLETLKRISFALDVSIYLFLDIDNNYKNDPNYDYITSLDDETPYIRCSLIDYLINYSLLPSDVAYPLCDEIMDYIKLRINHIKNNEQGGERWQVTNNYQNIIGRLL